MRILVFLKIGQNWNVCSGKQITVPMFLRIGPKFQKKIIIPMLREKGQNPNVLRIRSENQSV